MEVDFKYLPEFERRAKDLAKKYKSFVKDYDDFLDSLEKNPFQGTSLGMGVCPGQVMRYHHVDFPVMKTPIEVHFTPSYMFCPWHNRRMQRWFGKVMDLQCSNVVSLPNGFGEIAVPTTSFNVIYILSHLYRHVFTEGIGLRQLLDYYFVIEKFFSRQSYHHSFSNHPVPLSKEGSTFSPSPSFSESGDVAGTAIALPEFWYRQRSLCPQGAADDFLRNRVAIVLRLIGDCLCGVTPPC